MTEAISLTLTVPQAALLTEVMNGTLKALDGMPLTMPENDHARAMVAAFEDITTQILAQVI